MDILLHHQVANTGALVEDSKLVIKGNDISAVGAIRFGGASVELVFENNNVDNRIYSNGIERGRLTVAGNNVVFTKPIGHDGMNLFSISALQIENNKTATLKSDIYSNDIVLGQNSKLIIDSSKQNIDVWSGVASNNPGDDHGIVEVKGKNAVIFRKSVGLQDFRVAEIKIGNENKAEFKQNVYAKKITVASNDVEFQEKLDMTQYNQDNRGNRTNLIHTGNLEFTNRGKVKFNKDLIGNITTSKAGQGEVTFVNTSNIYEVSAVNKRIEKLTFTESCS
ncbi:hypothetical protein RMONA_01820 [Rickettsia monacensis]|uniref:Uncharacterized protein n=1 Tax=Rickettsia monacensis TaxID=109232 RepID=A0A0B7J327_9RICK|nr:hypothetical protein [Rickettsia monacensis]CDI28992.1 hypothetical protein RMONA_1605 [Rickettsia monacensis IrR/Munich]CEO16773.1 hypothetical protein RMONA_01820 [Rickettsia monacensis]